MSRNNTYNASLTKFCKVCQDAGKSEEVYRSHFTRETRELNAKVTCPTLLALECRYCYKNGHTVKYCPTLKEKAYYEKKGHFVKHTEPSKKPNESNAAKNTFAHLVCDDSDEEDKEKPVTLTKKSVSFLQNDDKETPVDNNKKKATPAIKSYASVLAAPVPVRKPVLTPVAELKAAISTRPAPWAETKIKKPPSRVNWAAMESDSDDEEVDYEEVDYEEVNYEEVDETW